VGIFDITVRMESCWHQLEVTRITCWRCGTGNRRR